MRRWIALAAQLFTLVSLGLAKSATGNSVLVLLENDLPRENFTIFFNGLEERGFELTFRDPKQKAPLIIEDDVPQFAHVVFFAPTTKSYAPDISPQSLVTLLSSDVNIIFALSPAQTPLTSLAAEFSLIPAPPHTPLISHFSPTGDRNIVSAPVPTEHPILSSNIPPVLFSGTPHAFSPNPFIVPILRAPPEAFAAESNSDADADSLVDASEKGGEGLWAGSSLGLVTGFQTRTGARALWAGGVEVFSDKYAEVEGSGNGQFVQDIAKWTFKESNVLRIDQTAHKHASSNSTEPPSQYTVKDMIEYSAEISKWNSESGEWVPYSGVDDLQLEFTMLDPFVRTSLPPNPEQPGKYSLVFRAPDRHGVFKFVVDYKRRGWNFLNSAMTVPVVPPRHDGYPRFLSAAWPYYTGAISTSAAFVLFCVLWLAGGGAEKTGKGKKAK